MKTRRNAIQNEYAAFDRALKRSKEETYMLRLYVTGATSKSLRAIENIKRICEEHLQGRYRLEVVDVYQQPVLAKGEQIIAAPTLVKHLPAPLRKFIGDMADAERILLGWICGRRKPGRGRPGPRPRGAAENPGNEQETNRKAECSFRPRCVAGRGG